MLVNHIYSVEAISAEEPVVEPVLLAEMKDYMRLEGFEPSDAPSQVDFDDALIEGQISEGRQWLERITGVVVIPKTLKIVLLNQAGGLRLPGPKTGDITYFEESGCQALATTGGEFPRLSTSCCNQQTIEYTAGYTDETRPSWVRNAIKAYVAWAYENRGDEAGKGQPERALSIARPFRKLPLWG